MQFTVCAAVTRIRKKLEFATTSSRPSGYCTYRPDVGGHRCRNTSDTVPAPSDEVLVFAVAVDAPSATSYFDDVYELAVVTAAENRPTSSLAGVFEAVTPSNSTHHSMILIRVVDDVAISITDLAVAAVRAIASAVTQYSCAT